jgi:hypothetical protein
MYLFSTAECICLNFKSACRIIRQLRPHATLGNTSDRSGHLLWVITGEKIGSSTKGIHSTFDSIFQKRPISYGNNMLNNVNSQKSCISFCLNTAWILFIQMYYPKYRQKLIWRFFWSLCMLINTGHTMCPRSCKKSDFQWNFELELNVDLDPLELN